MVAVRRFAATDVVDVLRIARRSFGKEFPADVFLRVADAAPDFVLVAVDEATGDVVGFVLAAPQEARVARLLLIGVAPAMQGGGVGRRLMRALQRACTLAGVRTLRLEVRPDNAGAIGFYRRFGFEFAGYEAGAYEDGADAMVMRRAVA
jgi:ribosomal protein S18 acetylase RimI-like enzyme